MSIKLMQLVWEQDVPQGPKLLLLCLADYSNDEGESYPGTDTICARCSFSEASLYRHLNQLEADNFLARHQMGDRTLYVLNVEKLRQLSLLSEAQNGAGRKARGLALREVHPVKVRPGKSQFESHSQIETPSNRELGPLTVRVGTSQIETPIKQPPANPQEPPPAAPAGRGAQFAALPEFDQRLIDPYLGQLHPSVTLGVFADFVKHRNVCRRPLSFSSWKQIQLLLKQMHADGHNLDESLRQTMRKGLCEPIRPNDPGAGQGRPRPPRANDDFSNVEYGKGTATDDLPAHLRPDEPTDETRTA
ncbi:MAG: helix-turn-helix domain-containing protein [Pseudoxanthomonas sp.]